MTIQKIELQIKRIQLEALLTLFTVTEFNVSMTRERKTSLSVLNQVHTKLGRKLLSKKGVKKPFKMTFEFYEADALEGFIRPLLENIEDASLQTVADTLHQKLA